MLETWLDNLMLVITAGMAGWIIYLKIRRMFDTHDGRNWLRVVVIVSGLWAIYGCARAWPMNLSPSAIASLGPLLLAYAYIAYHALFDR